MDVVLDVLSAAAMLTGASLAVLAGIGLHRFPDVFARMHAATKPATLGLTLVLIGAALRVDEAESLSKLAIAIALQFLTAPVSAHMVGRAAYRAGGQLSGGTRVDELATAGGFGSPRENQDEASGPYAG